MSANVSNQTPYLRTTRDFPIDAAKLSEEVDKTYLDVANAVNQRTIGIYPANKPAVTGNAFFISGQKQQSLRQIYSFTSTIVAGGTLSIPVQTYNAPYIDIYGACQTAQPDSRPLPYASTGANSNIDIRVDKTTKSIVISVGAGSPSVNSGYIVLEWISAV